MESRNDASVLESRTVYARNNKCQPLERERISSSSSSPNKRFTTSKNLEITQRKRRKIRGFNKELSEGDKWLKRAKDSGSCRWQYSSVVREMLDSTADSHSNTEEFVFKMSSLSVNEVSTSGWTNESDNEGKVGLEQFMGFPGQLESYPPGSDTFREFCKAKAVIRGKWGNCVEFACRTWYDNIIWVKGNCLQRDDEEPLDLRFRSVKQSVKSTVERKESLLDEVAEEKTELELFGLAEPCQTEQSISKVSEKWILKALPTSGTTGSGEVAKDKRRRVEPSGVSGEKVTEGRSTAVDDLKEVEEGARLAVLHGEEDTSKMVAHLVKRIWLGIVEEKIDLKKANAELEKELARSRTDALKEVRQLKASHAAVIGQLQVETKANLDEMVEERDRLGRHLMLKGYSEEVDSIKADTYVEEEDEEEAEAVVKEMSLRINSLESRLVREKETSKALLSAQAELQGHVQKGNANLRECQHKLDAALIRKKVLEGEIKEKESLVKRKDKLLKEMPAREELNAKIGRFSARVVDLEAMNLVESTKYINKLKENVIYHAKVNGEMTELKNEYDRSESRLERLRARFVTMVVPDTSQSDLLRAIVAYFVEEVKRLE
ncbi:hypothetical protein GIB67_026267 [Kingdonia uniflora]|uniref:Uncharacterized protein n=1 Tax=Kingdonia uniflora TaxID=39325 RepID=A0A7J7L9W4_9MAGN|nr:hypothetical protein GIB67_026267 [Kingdonia uniflora]